MTNSKSPAAPLGNGVQYGGCTSSVQKWMCSTDQTYHQQRMHIISTDAQYALRWRVCSTNLSHHQYGGGCMVGISHISDDEGVWYRTTKTAQGAVSGCIYL